MAGWEEHLRAHRERYLDDLISVLRIPSVSTLSAHRADVRRCAAWIADYLRAAGLEHVEQAETHGHPVVCGEWLHAAGAPTVLVYGHYDVQPPDPLDLWTTPPFAPDVREGRLYARGAKDMKGGFMAAIQACRAHLASSGALPVNVRFVIEGEEEIGSPSLPAWLSARTGQLACDFALNADGGQLAPDLPTVTVGTKGICGLQVDVRTGESDLHSGLYGGIVHNAVQVLAGVVASLLDGGRIQIPEFYDDVRMPTPADRAACARFDAVHPDGDGVTSESGHTQTETTWLRPTLSVNGFWGGFQGEGGKTVIPCEAHAKITVRLVADQRPERVLEALRRHVAASVPAGVEVAFSQKSGTAEPYLIPEEHGAVRIADAALHQESGAEPVHWRSGATVPVLAALHRILGVEVVTVGLGRVGSNIHAPDEWLDLDMYESGRRVYARFLECARAMT